MNKLTTCRNPHSSHQSLYRMDRNSNFPITNPYGSEEYGWRSHNTMFGSHCKLISDHSLAPMFETRSRAMFDYPGMADKGLGSLQNNSNFTSSFQYCHLKLSTYFNRKNQIVRNFWITYSNTHFLACARECARLHTRQEPITHTPALTLVSYHLALPL